MQVAALRVDVSDGDRAAEVDVGGDIAHALVVQGGLELGAHEAVAVAGVAEALEVDREHGEVEDRGDTDEAVGARQEVLEPHTLRGG